MIRSLPPATRRSVRALAESFVPEISQASAALWDRVETVFCTQVGARPPRVQRRIMLFIRVLGWAAALRYGRGMASLTTTQRASLLRGFERSPLLLFRRGVWGLRTLVLMGYYADPEIQTAIGYRATAAGWAARR